MVFFRAVFFEAVVFRVAFLRAAPPRVVFFGPVFFRGPDFRVVFLPAAFLDAVRFAVDVLRLTPLFFATRFAAAPFVPEAFLRPVFFAPFFFAVDFLRGHSPRCEDVGSPARAFLRVDATAFLLPLVRLLIAVVRCFSVAMDTAYPLRRRSIRKTACIVCHAWRFGACAGDLERAYADRSRTERSRYRVLYVQSTFLDHDRPVCRHESQARNTRPPIVDHFSHVPFVSIGARVPVHAFFLGVRCALHEAARRHGVCGAPPSTRACGRGDAREERRSRSEDVPVMSLTPTGRRRFQRVLTLCLLLAATSPAPTFATSDRPSGADSADVDDAVRTIMRRDDVPAISVAIVRDDAIVDLKAYGDAALPNRAATVSTRFAIGSITKQFTAAAILVLVDREKLSLDDTVSKYLPELTGSGRVTIRELLSHTSGYRDYFLQEYIPARMQRPTSVDSILRTWAERPLDFEPGSQWQYSGTNYVIAGRIVERVAGEPFEKFLADDVLRPIGITDETFADRPAEADAVGYYRFALGPPRPAPLTGRNWLFAMADLEMTAKDVALWDISLMKRTLLSTASYVAMETDIKTTTGESTGYGLGVFVANVAGSDGKRHVMLHHPGEISGFRSHDFVLPESKSALVILTNAEYSDATSELARALQPLVGVAPALPPAAERAGGGSPLPTVREENAIEARAHRLMLGLARGEIDRGPLTSDASATFTAQALNDIRESLAPLGDLKEVTLDSTRLRGGTHHYALTLTYQSRRLQIAEYDTNDGKIEQFLIDDGA